MTFIVGLGEGTALVSQSAVSVEAVKERIMQIYTYEISISIKRYITVEAVKERIMQIYTYEISISIKRYITVEAVKARESCRLA